MTIIFTRTKRTGTGSRRASRRGFAAGSLTGTWTGAREQALRAFRNSKIDVLVATDVAARGIDVKLLTHVFNFQAPDDEKTYLHRVGRTGRAGLTGIAVTLVDWEDMPRWKLIAQALEIEQVEPVETYSASPHLYEDLDIPEGTKGRLPKAQHTREVSIPNIQKSLVDQISADGNNRHAAVSALAKAATVVVAAVVKADSASALAQVPRNKVMISSPPSSHVVVVTGLGVATVR